MHGLLGVELPLEEVGDLRQVSQVKITESGIKEPVSANNEFTYWKGIEKINGILRLSLIHI